MGNRTYWRADTEMSEKIRAVWDQREAMFAKAKKLGRKLGAKPGGVVYVNRTWSTAVEGFVFQDDTPPDSSWCRIKKYPSGWRPRAKTEVANLLDELECNTVCDVMNLVGMKATLNCDGGGFSMNSVGIAVVGDVAYLIANAGVIPKGCERITDIEYEQATAEKPKKKAAKVKS